MSENPEPTVKLFSYEEDMPKNGAGMLIPRKGAPKPKLRPRIDAAVVVGAVASPKVVRVAATMLAVFALVVVGMSGYGLVAQGNLALAPTVTIIDPYTKTMTEMAYGPQDALAKRGFYIETRDAFIEEGMTFVEVDVTSHQLRFFKRGVLLQSSDVLGVGEAGSWWDTPSGLYKIEKKDAALFTNTGQAYLPWLLTFQGNYLIHGWPSYPDGEPTAEDFAGGGIKLADADAEALYDLVSVGTPVLVHAEDTVKRDLFVYQPQVPELTTDHYFIADLDNGTILAASEAADPVPIASLVKLMTAVVAAETISLDGRVKVTSPTFVTSLIPRLSERSSVSMYSLLQLLLVESSNEAAETIAGEAGRTEFLEAMNAKARQLGMMDTHFADPSGLSAENVSSIADLYRLTKYIYEDKRFIFDITANNVLSSVYLGGEFEGLMNFNRIEGMDSFIGGKVGETTAAGQTSISLHALEFQAEDRTLIVILLGSSARTTDVETLLSYVQNRYGN